MSKRVSEECDIMMQTVEKRKIEPVVRQRGNPVVELSADLQKRHQARQNDVQRYVSYRLRSQNQKSLEAEIKVPHNYANQQ